MADADRRPEPADREAIVTDRSRVVCYDWEGNPLTLEQWAVMLEDIHARRVAKTTIGVRGGTVDVSTVWIGIDTGWGQGRPMIFETMVFGGSMDGRWTAMPPRLKRWPAMRPCVSGCGHHDC